MQSFFIWLLEQLFPPRCLGCQKYGAELCTHCKKKLIYSKQWVKRGRVSILTFFSYQDPFIEKIIHEWKYHRNKKGLNHLFELILHEDIPHGMLIPIPMHKKRRYERGENHLNYLLTLFNVKHGVSHTNALKRIKNTKQQALLSKEERRENMLDAFICIEKIDAPVVLILDDVVSTGGTLMSAIEALEKDYSGEIIGICLARNEKNGI